MANLIGRNAPQPIVPYGQPLVTRGFENQGMADGYGLLTFGLTWEKANIWFDLDFYKNLSTTWSLAFGQSISTTWVAAFGQSISTTWVKAFGQSISTTWVAAFGSSVSTAWTPVQFGVWGDYTP